jgi:omega-amidase
MLEVTGIQFPIIWEDKNANLEQLDSLINDVSDSTDILILPEMFTTGFSMNPVPYSETMEGTTVNWMKNIAKKMDSAVCGSIMIQEKNIYRNRFLWVLPGGEIDYYDKAHPFCLNQEGKYFEAGKNRKVFEYKAWRIFPNICYDLRFPIWNRNDMNYDLYINVANWPSIRSFAWKQFLSARALENQAYTIGINRIGTDVFGVEFSGDSRIVSFDGTSVIEAIPGNTQILHAILSKEKLDNYRKKYPFLADRDLFELKK